MQTDYAMIPTITAETAKQNIQPPRKMTPTCWEVKKTNTFMGGKKTRSFDKISTV